MGKIFSIIQKFSKRKTRRITGFRCKTVTGRFYPVDGEQFVSVTTVLQILNKPGLALWRGRVGNAEADRVSRESAGLGTRVHRAIELINLRQEPPTEHAMQPFIAAYRQWLEDNVAYVIAAERLVISRTHQYAGTADLVALLKGDDAPTVIDLKTSNGVSEDWPLQLGAYRLALTEDGVVCARRLVVRLPSREPGKLYTHEFDDHERDERAFVNALKLWRWAEGQKKPKEPSMRIQFTRSRVS